MFSYFGSKSKIAKYYPSPRYDTIIEPFAGAAWYSILYRHKKVILNEKNYRIYRIWRWLIEEATPEEILSNSDFYIGEDIRRLDLREEHKDLIGFNINRGSNSPRNIVQRWSCQVRSRPNWASTVNFSLRRVASLLPDIKHWKVIFGDYSLIENTEATWFIDPPYQRVVNSYIHDNIDYECLSEWSLNRKGHIIVCENEGADWLRFKPLTEKRYGQCRYSTEVYYEDGFDTYQVELPEIEMCEI